MTLLGASAGYRALTQGVAACRQNYDLVHADGPDTTKFLQSQLSQDIEKLPIGATKLSFLLHPQGRIVAVVQVTRKGESEIELLTDRGFGEPVRAALERFKIRTKCTLTTEPVERFAIRGPLAPEGGVWATWPGIDVVAVPEGIDEVEPSVFEMVRIERGIPRNGAEIEEKTLPAETGLVEGAVNFTKGCYVGQELVERIDSRGHVNRRLRGLDFDHEPPEDGVAVGATISADDKSVGTLTSVARRVVGPGLVALGYLRREIEPGAVVRVRAGAATVREL